MMMIDPNIVTIGPKMMKIDPKMVFLQENRGENRDYKTVIRKPFEYDLAHELSLYIVVQGFYPPPPFSGSTLNAVYMDIGKGKGIISFVK